EFEQQIEQITVENKALQQELDALQAQETLREASTHYMDDLETLLRSFRPRLDAVGAQDATKQRQLLEILIDHVRIDTYGAGHKKQYKYYIEWNMAGIGLQN